MRLYELAYSCRLYAAFTDFDRSIKKFREATSNGLDLNDPSHRLALLKWLNSWGCRQFAKSFHTTASENLKSWGKLYLDRLPSPGTSMIKLAPTTLNVAAEAYANLKDRLASIRRAKSVTFGSTGASKVLAALRPNALPPWDDPIRKRLRYDGSPESYLRYLMTVQSQLRDIKAEAARCNIPLDEIPVVLGRPESSLPKLVDEYNWVTYTRGCVAPSIEELSRWINWTSSSHQP
jgi:hypothetical protein